MTSNIVHVLTREAKAEHNPYKWDLAVMLYALQRMRDTSAPQQPQAQSAFNTPLRQDTTA